MMQLHFKPRPMMQLLRVAELLSTLTLLQASAAKVTNLVVKLQSSNATTVCPNNLQNRFPDTLEKSYNITQEHSTNPLDAIWDTTKLREALEKDDDWAIGKHWWLKAKFTSDSDLDHTFAFAGGGGGFLKIVVPAGAQEQVIQVSDMVALPADKAKFEYREPADWTTGTIYMTDICLTPMSCDFYTCAESERKKGEGIFGHSSAECCEKKLCQEEEVKCEPVSQYRKHENYSLPGNPKPGYGIESCCVPLFCPENLCANDTKWTDKGETGIIGSLPEECCHELFCASYNCSDPRRWRKLGSWVDGETGVARIGSTDNECCEPIYCSEFYCERWDSYQHKAGAESIQGSDRDTCCDILNCTEFVCPNNTKWRPSSSAEIGNSMEQCCEQIFCKDYTCSQERLQKLPNETWRQGSTDEECCEVRNCMDWTCSDETMWVKEAAQTAANNVDRRGWSDEECCEKRYCLAETCDPATQWTRKPPLEDGTPLQGSTYEQCCDAVYCRDFQCDTDIDNDGMGTAWYKKVDTNHFHFQGSTEEECCYPIYCSQYTTTHETRWKRKEIPGLQGSTDEECYTRKLCSDYCCADETLLKIPNDHLHQGSTDEECCISRY